MRARRITCAGAATARLEERHAPGAFERVRTCSMTFQENVLKRAGCELSTEMRHMWLPGSTDFDVIK
jgi:hypothetical protein